MALSRSKNQVGAAQKPLVAYSLLLTMFRFYYELSAMNYEPLFLSSIQDPVTRNVFNDILYTIYKINFLLIAEGCKLIAA
ncbi:MAG: hypothetical protein A4E64_00367 [Syntrophorhabdus sp. PtaU1.Bin058]|nr:MAG: hypothetical protein A4E64_00367 [Syntrophorhabdus sp. PtaU1.Bin058]